MMKTKIISESYPQEVANAVEAGVHEIKLQDHL